MAVNANEVADKTASASASASPVAAAAVKYHLVEAEEVGGQGAGAAAKGAKAKKKGKLNWSQYPAEGEEEEEELLTPAAKTTPATPERSNNETRGRGHHHGRGGRGARGGRFGGRGGRGRANFDSNGTYINGVYVPNPDVKVSAQWAKNQIEFYFTSDNLVRDIFLRQHMDVDGYVPLAFVGSFQAVYSVHQDYASLLEAMKHSETLELDEQNEKIRLREGWQKWVWPNAEGGYGVPRYIKLAEGEEPTAVAPEASTA